MELYWILRLPHLHDLFGVITGALILVFSFSCFISFLILDDPEKFKTFRIMIISSLCAACLSGVICCLIPSRTDLAIMLGWDAIKSESVQEVIDILKDKLINE